MWAQRTPIAKRCESFGAHTRNHIVLPDVRCVWAAVRRRVEKRSNDDHSGGAELRLLQVVERSRVSWDRYVWRDGLANREGTMPADPKVDGSELLRLAPSLEGVTYGPSICR